LRKLFQVFGRGSLRFLNPENRKILAYLRDLDRGDDSHETVLCVANLSRFAQPVSLDLSDYAGHEPVEMLGYVPFPPINETPYAITLAPYSFLWLELQPASVEPEPIPEPPTEAEGDAAVNRAAALDLLTKGWSGLLAGHGQALLEAALPAWLSLQRWFGAKTRKIQSARVVEWVVLPADYTANASIPDAAGLAADSTIPPALFFVEIAYADGPADIYQIPLAFSTAADAVGQTANHPQSILARLPTPIGPGVLHDATTREDFRQGLLTVIERNATLSLSTIRTADLEIAASLTAASTGHTANESLASGEAADLLHHPERATHAPAMGSTVHLRPHEVFPSQDGAPTDSASIASTQDAFSAPTAQHAAAGLPVAPAPLSAQPGEAATPPSSDAPSKRSEAAPQLQSRESPLAGDSAPHIGRLEARASSAFPDAHFSHPLPSRVGSAEQSNTSLLYDKQLILKLFRRLQPGENPDVEIGRFLTEVACFPCIAPFLGEIAITAPSGDKTTIAMLQGLVDNQGDGWQWFLGQLSGFFAFVAALPAPPDAPGPSFLSSRPPQREALQYAGSALKAAALLGRRTAEMHLALATPTKDPAFAGEPFTSEDLARDAHRIDAQITSTLEALKIKLSTLKDLTADDAGLLLSRRIDLFARANAITASTAGGQRIRIHGDYHLGQTLRTARMTQELAPEPETDSGDFVLLDFEGEPARLLAERRQKQSPLKDVAGMIRSLSYAAYSGLDQFLTSNPELTRGPGSENATAWAILWQNSTSSEFLSAYRETMAVNPTLLPSPQQSQALLAAYMLEKALYELLYELNNRPSWLRIPLAGILTL
jgi:maltose alpha-D-glucosyltransferase/alpha-amylase